MCTYRSHNILQTTYLSIFYSLSAGKHHPIAQKQYISVLIYLSYL